MTLLPVNGFSDPAASRGARPDERPAIEGRLDGSTALLGPAGPGRAGLLRRVAPPGSTFGVTPTDTLFERLDVAGNVGFPLRARGIAGGEGRRIAAELLALTGLERDGGRAVRTLSGAERALLRLARAAATGRPILLVDDLASGLDGAGRERVFAALRRIARLRRAAIVYATADREDAFAVADRIAVIDGGEIVRVGTPGALMADPGSAAVARAVGESNILVARVRPVAADPDDAEVTLASGHVVPARLAPGVDPGALCLLAIPPGRVAFAPVPASRMGEGAVAATLIDHRHETTHLRLRLRLEDGAVMVVHRPPGSLSPRDAAAAGDSLGASLAWRAADATAFPHSDA